MTAAVVLATVFCTLSQQIGLLLGATGYVVRAQGDFLNGVLYTVTTVPSGLLAPGLATIFALAFGFYAALAWPRRNVRGYLLIVLLGLITGILVWGGNVSFGVLGGVLGLPTSDSYTQAQWWYTGWDEMRRYWDFTFSTYFLSTALLFMAGGFLGHALKPRKLSDRGPGWAYRLLNKFSRGDRAPNQLLVKAVSQLPTIGITTLGILIKVLAPLLETTSQSLPLDFYKNLVP